MLGLLGALDPYKHKQIQMDAKLQLQAANDASGSNQENPETSEFSMNYEI